MQEITSIRLDNATKQQIEVIKINYYKNMHVKLNTSEVIRAAVSTLYNKLLSNK